MFVALIASYTLHALFDNLSSFCMSHSIVYSQTVNPAPLPPDHREYQPPHGVGLKIYPTWVSVEPGMPVTLDCMLKCTNKSVCDPTPRLAWRSESGYMNSGARVDSGRLTIPAVDTRDEQYYICEAVSRTLSLSVRTVIVVRSKCE